MKFRKLPVVIEAMRYEPTDDVTKPEIRRKYGKFIGKDMCDIEFIDLGASMRWFIVIPTLEGRMIAEPGDWIIRGIKGEFYPCKSDIFEATYEPI